MEIPTLAFQSLKDALNDDPVNIFILFAVLFVFVSLVIWLAKRASFHPYHKTPLFSKAEHSFYLILKQSIPDHLELFAKVRIADILTPEKSLSHKKWKAAFHQVSSKHFDYVLCDKKTLSVIAVIELDDSSHLENKTKRRDAFVEKACLSADLKLLRFKCARHYDVETIREDIYTELKLKS